MSNSKKALRFSEDAMHAHFTVFFDGDETDPALAQGAAREAFLQLAQIEQTISRFIASSDIARVNSLAPEETYELSPESLECLVAAATIAAATNRAYDPSAGALVDFWKSRGAGAGERDGASDAFLAAFAADCENDDDWRKAWERHRLGEFALDAEARAIRCVTPGSLLDLGGIGKGFALDVMARVIKEEWELTRVLLSAGGSTVLALDAPLAKPAGWQIGFGGETRLPYLNLVNSALSSSGTEEQATHLVDPRNGHLITRRDIVRSVAPTAAEADALSTAFCVMNREEADEYCLRNEQHHALFALALGDDGVADTFFTPSRLAPPALNFEPREDD
jgi:thiamine biosynthesis lipoprotein